MSTDSICGRSKPAPTIARVWEPGGSVPVAQQTVTVLCGGVYCTKKRAQLTVVAGTFPEKIFKTDSPFLSRMPFENGKWNWEVMGTDATDVPHVRKLLSIICPPGPDWETRLHTSAPRVKELARTWQVHF